MAGKVLRVATDADAEKAALVERGKRSLAQVVEDGTYLEILVAQRRQMIRDVGEVSGPAKAALHRQIALTSKEIAALQAEEEQEASEDAEVADEAFDTEAL